MSNLIESATWEAGVYQLETTDPVLGGPEGIDNLQAKQLANRTTYLKALVDALGTGKQPIDATLTALAALVTAADKIIYATANDVFATTTLTAFMRTLLDDVDAATARATLGAASPADIATAIANLVASSPAALDTLNELATALGNDPNFATTITNALAGKQPIDTDLSAIAALVSAANKMPYATGAGTWALADLSAFARSILAGADAAAARGTLGAVSKNGDIMNGDLMLYRDGAMNTGALYLSSSGTRYLYFDGTVFSLAGGDLWIGPSRAATLQDLTGTAVVLGGKTFNLASNTLIGTMAQFNAACSDGDFAFAGETFGFGQTWQNVTASRAAGTTYTNTTGKPISIAVRAGNVSSSAQGSAAITVAGEQISYFHTAAEFQGAWGSTENTQTAVVPPGATYSVALSNAVIVKWSELR